MIRLLVWLVYGLVVGMLSKAIYRYEDSPKGMLSTLAIGVAGSYVGGFVSYLLGHGDPLQPSGIALGVLGGVLTSLIYRKLVVEKRRKDARA